MTQDQITPRHGLSPFKPILIGALAGLAFVSLFVITALDDANPYWSRFWMLRPLIVVTMAGGMGGLFFYFMHYLGEAGKMNKTAAVIISIIVYIISIWLGMVAGLDGTFLD